MLQKVQHLQIEIEEYKEREKRLKSSQRKLIQALQAMDGGKETRMTQELIVRNFEFLCFLKGFGVLEDGLVGF